MPRLFRHPIHGIEDQNRELGAHLIRVQISGFDCPTEPRGRVTRLSLIHDQSDDVIRALLTGAKIRVRPRELVVYFANGAF